MSDIRFIEPPTEGLFESLGADDLFRVVRGDRSGRGRVSQVANPFVNFETYKANGASDGEALQAAIDAAAAFAGGGDVVIPPGGDLVFTAPIEARAGVTVRGTRRLYVPSWTHGTSVGLFQVDGVDDFGIEGLTIETNGRLCGPAVITGGAEGFTARGLRLVQTRSLFFENGGAARLHDIIARENTAAIGCGSGASANVYDIVATAIQAYDCTDEAVDVNYDTVGFVLNGFIFRRCNTGGAGETIDIGGGTCSDIVIANGVIDCGGTTGFAQGGIKIKLASKRVTVSGVKIINGDAAVSTAYAIHIADACESVNVLGCDVDTSFARGFYIENGTAKDIAWRGGTCNSPIIINGVNVTVDATHDGEDTASTTAGVAFGAAAFRCEFNGEVKNRPSANGVSAASGAEECGIGRATISTCLRGFEGVSGSSGLYVRSLECSDVLRYGVVMANVPYLRIDYVRCVDCSAQTSGSFAAVHLGNGCDQAVIGTVISQGATGGRALHLAATSSGDIDQVTYHKAITIGTAATGVTSTNVTNLTAGTAITWT